MGRDYESNRVYMRTRYNKRKEEQRCTHCGRPLSDAEKILKHLECEICRVKQKLNYKPKKKRCETCSVKFLGGTGKRYCSATCRPKRKPSKYRKIPMCAKPKFPAKDESGWNLPDIIETED